MLLPANGFGVDLDLAPFPGREREPAALEGEIAKTTREARVVGLIGEAGLGKSRLCFEFAEACRRRDFGVLEARVFAHGRATPFNQFSNLFGTHSAIRPNEPSDVSRRRIAWHLRSRGDFGEMLPLLLDFWVVSDPRTRRRRIPRPAKCDCSVCLATSYLETTREVVVVLVDDLHWIDSASEEFVESIVDAIVGTKTLLVLNFRPGLTAPWMQRSHYRQISLAPLESREGGPCSSICRAIDPSLALLSRNIAERGQGNPFFLEELVHSLVERGDLRATGAIGLRAELNACRCRYRPGCLERTH